MKRNEAALADALDRVDEFLRQHRAVVAGPVTESALARFGSLRERLVGHMKTQAAARQLVRERTQQKRQLRRVAVEEHMRPITLLAQAELGASPATFRVPRMNARFGEVVATGYGLAEAATPHKEALVAAGLREDFIERLVAATDALRDATRARSDVAAQRTEATALLEKDGRLARLRLRALDIAIRSAIKPDQPLYDRWVNLSRVASTAATAVASDATPKPELTDVPVPVEVEVGGGEEAAKADVAA
jgi:hypothetical protein